jgi:transposase InsO family protein
VEELTSTFGLSQRRACSLLEQSRSTLRYKPKPATVEQDLVLGRMHQLVAENPRFGYRRIAALLRQEGFVANPKRIHRLWVKEGYKVPVRVVRKRRLGTAQGGVTRLRATAPDQIWAWDFFHDRLEDGRAIKWLACVDEYTR